MYFFKFFEKRYRQCKTVQWGVGQRSWVIFENFCGKNVKLHKKLAEQNVLVAPAIILFGEQLFALLARLPRLCMRCITEDDSSVRPSYVSQMQTIQVRLSVTVKSN